MEHTVLIISTFTFILTLPPPCNKEKCHLQFWDARKIKSQWIWNLGLARNTHFFVIIGLTPTPNLHFVRPGRDSVRHHWQCVVLEKCRQELTFSLSWLSMSSSLSKPTVVPWDTVALCFYATYGAQESSLRPGLLVPRVPLHQACYMASPLSYCNFPACRCEASCGFMIKVKHLRYWKPLPSLLRTPGIILFFSLAIPKEERDIDFQQLLFSHSQNFLNPWFQGSLRA